MSFAAEVPAASIESLTRASKLHNLLVSRHILVGKLITWEGTEYDVSSFYLLCDAYEGICYKGYQAGFNEPIMLAVSQDAAGELAIQVVDYVKFKKDRSQEAIQFYKDSRRLTDDQVFGMKDAQGQDLFDAMGNLTKPGENSYETELEGKSVGGAAKAPPVKKGGKIRGSASDGKDAKAPGAGGKKRKGKANAKFSKIPIKQLLEMGYREIYAKELDCIHTIPLDDSELFMEMTNETGRVRWFLNPKDPAYNVAMKFRREKVCAPYGAPAK